MEHKEKLSRKVEELGGERRAELVGWLAGWKDGRVAAAVAAVYSTLYIGERENTEGKWDASHIIENGEPD